MAGEGWIEKGSADANRASDLEHETKPTTIASQDTYDLIAGSPPRVVAF